MKVSKNHVKSEEMEMSSDSNSREEERRNGESLCLIKTDIWVPLLNRYIHLSMAYEDRRVYVSLGTRRPSADSVNRPSSSLSEKRIGLKS